MTDGGAVALLAEAHQPATHLLDRQAVRDTIAAVFADPGYDQSLRQSIGDRLLTWLFRAISSVVEAVRGYANIRWVVIALAVVLVLFILARSAYLAAVQSKRGLSARSRRERGGIDPWMAADDAAARNRHDEAVHLLYSAVLEAIARHHQAVLHPARTTGEYERALRSRDSVALSRFTAFARAYERAVWRKGSIDARTYHNLRLLAADLVEPPRREAA